MNIQIRNASIYDLNSIAQIESTCFPPAEAADRHSISSRLQTFPESFFVAETDDGMIVGFINGCVTNTPALPDELYHNSTLHQPNGKYQTIFGLDVLPEYRCQGIATQLMKHMIDITKQRGKSGILLTCKDHLIQYYEKFGYIHQGHSSSSHGGASWNDMLLLF